MSDSWTISVSGQTYGPYTLAQMQAFAGEGRLAPQSLVRRSGEAAFRPAAEDPALAELFRTAQPQARAAPFFSAEAKEERAAFGRSETSQTPGERSRFIIVADMKSRSIAGLEEEIFNLGPTVAIMPQAWLVASQMSIS
ncbi:MAG TPA: GYF domain-containing protein, partial [Rhizomicrobium sp.]|nr:GYF domain-containing protein [Rhizomicrobium sp.]